MDRVALRLGPIKIYWYSICIFIGIILGSILLFKEVKKRNIDEDKIVNLIFIGLISAFIGARLYYVLFNFNVYKENPIDIFKVWEGGLAIHGGIIAAIIVILIYSKKHKMNFYELLDLLVVSLILGQAIGRWGNFFNQEAYGGPTTLLKLKELGIPNFVINGMYIPSFNKSILVEPTFYYESCWDLLVFITLILVRKFYKNLKIGNLTSLYLIMYSFGRFFIEGLRTDSLMLGKIRVAQLVSIILIIIGFITLITNKNELYHKEKDK